MAHIRLRPVQEADLDALTRNESREADPWNWFGEVEAGRRHRRLAEGGMISDEQGTLAVETPDGTLAGGVSWHAVQHGPNSACRAMNIGISLFPEHRGRGYGSAAQRDLAQYLFATTLVERVEATTDVEKIGRASCRERG